MSDNLECKIISNLMYNSEFAGKVVPYTKGEYFEDYGEIAEEICKFFNKYGQSPTKSELKIEIRTRKGLTDKAVNLLMDRIDAIPTGDKSDFQWLMEKTEKFYQTRAMANAVINGAELIDRGDEQSGQILKMVEDALSVSFDNHIGLDYFEDVERRYEMYHTVEDKVSWGIPSLDRITVGGMSKKTATCCVASTGSGKSAMMCAISANVIRQGKNVLYISMEMSEDRVAERIDANLMNDTVYNVRNMNYKSYIASANKLKEKAYGRLIIREFPTSAAGVTQFKVLLKDLKTKKHFVPDLVVVDYMNICCSSRLKQGQTNSYGYIKAISEELRGLAVEYNVALLTATQTNRNGFNNSDVELTDISESIGSTHVMDMIFALIRTEALDDMGQIEIKQLKNRYSDPAKEPTIQLGFDRQKMKLYDLDSKENINNPSHYSSTIPTQSKPMQTVTPSSADDVPWKIDTGDNAPKNDFSSFQF